jgi:hypothetical protein
MMSITINETPTEKRWILQGKLVGPWVGELRTSWKTTHRDYSGRTCVVDLNDVSFIDKDGEKLLRSMSKQGAHLVAEGLYIKRVVERLKSGSKSGGEGATSAKAEHVGSIDREEEAIASTDSLPGKAARMRMCRKKARRALGVQMS